jgi:hypothetical protein
MRSIERRTRRLERRRFAIDKRALCRLGSDLYHDGKPLPPGLSQAEREFAEYFAWVLASVQQDQFGPPPG